MGLAPYGEPRFAAQLRAACRTTDDGGFALDPDSVPEEADLVVVGNPASPSGTLDPAATLLALRRPGRVLVVDEAFMDLVPGEPATLVRERLGDVIVVRSITKALAIPGLRAGYAVASAPLQASVTSIGIDGAPKARCANRAWSRVSGSTACRPTSFL